jgi:DNA anti-recombination protein RmuC
MPSNAYVATDGENVMKVGKANDVKRRERELAVPITFTIACLNEAAAFQVEKQLRDFVIRRGGIQYQGTIDWFKFDTQIYRMLCEFAANINSPSVVEKDLDEEIEELRTCYYQLLIHELTVENQRLREELNQLKESVRQLEEAKRASSQQYSAEMEQILKESARREGDLREQIGELKGMLRFYQERGDAK